MSEFGERIIKALESAVENPEGVKRHEISEVRRIRNKLRMSVPEFSKAFGLSQRAVRTPPHPGGQRSRSASGCGPGQPMARGFCYHRELGGSARQPGQVAMGSRQAPHDATSILTRAHSKDLRRPQ